VIYIPSVTLVALGIVLASSVYSEQVPYIRKPTNNELAKKNKGVNMDTFRSVLELIYFASGPLLLIVAIVGLRQLQIAKDTNRLHATRESLSLSAERCEHYLAHVIPVIDELYYAIEKNEIKFFSMAEVTIDGEKVRIKHNCPIEEVTQEFRKMNLIAPQLCAALNAMEAFAVFFTSRVADEKVAFSSVGHTYCKTVRKYLPDIIPISDQGDHYNNLLKLFFMWNARIEEERLLRDRNKIESELQKIENKFVRPLGTE